MSVFSKGRRAILAGAITIVTTVGLSSTVMADDHVDFSGKTVTMVNFGGPGSPPDVWFRSLVPFLEKHLPGSPKINIVNKPGAGSMISANYTAQALKPNGLNFGSMNAVAMAKAAGGDPSAKFDLRKLNVIGGQKLSRIVVAKKDSIKSIDDLIAAEEPLIIGMESAATVYFENFFKATGIKGKIISSYRRFPDTLQAFRTGEVDAMTMSTIEWLRFGPDLKENGAVAIWQVGFGENGKVVPTDAVDVPTGHAVVEKVNPDAVGSEEWNTMMIQASGQTVSKQVWAPVDTPQAYVNAMADAFVAATSDPEYQALHEKQYGIPVQWTDAKMARGIIDGVLAIYGN